MSILEHCHLFPKVRLKHLILSTLIHSYELLNTTSLFLLYLALVMRSPYISYRQARIYNSLESRDSYQGYLSKLQVIYQETMLCNDRA